MKPFLHLPEKQMKRIYAHYFLGLGCSAIAKLDGVNKSVVSRSLKAGIEESEEIFGFFFLLQGNKQAKNLLISRGIFFLSKGSLKTSYPTAEIRY